MLSILFLVTILYVGLLFRLALKDTKIPQFPFAFLVGSIIVCTFIFLTNFFIHNFLYSIAIYFLLLTPLFFLTYKKILPSIFSLKLNKENLLYLCFLIGAFFFFNKTFTYNDQLSSFLIESNLYLDFGAHIPFARYFSVGENFIPEVPFYAGGKLIYHFMFDFYVSVLERLGMRIDVAFNIISAFSLLFLLQTLIYLSYLIFKRKMVGIITFGLIILSTDLSFIDVIEKYGLSFASIFHHNEYIQKSISGINVNNFLNINTYVNQRHLIFALLFICSILGLIIETITKKVDKKKSLMLAVLIGIFPFWHFSVFISVYIILISLIFLFKERRGEIIRIIIISSLIAFPQLLLMKSSSVNEIIFRPGFLIAEYLSVQNLLSFWSWNLGLAIPLSFFGFILSTSFQKKIALAFIPLFIFPNLFQITRDMFDNHKFINIWTVFVFMLCAYALCKIFDKSNYGKALSLVLITVMSLSGVLHLLVVKNDVYAQVFDYKALSVSRWALENIPSGEIVFTNGDIYDPISLAGMRTFLGRSHYVYLYGGDPGERVISRSILLEAGNSLAKAAILNANNIKYVILYKDGSIMNIHRVNAPFNLPGFKVIYEDDKGVIYKK